MSGHKYGEYLHKFILEPAGLKNVFYDITYGYYGVAKQLSQFGYRSIIAPVSKGEEAWTLLDCPMSKQSHNPCQPDLDKPAPMVLTSGRDTSSLTACRNPTSAAVSPPPGARC